MVGLFVAGAAILRRDSRIPVVGIDPSRGVLEYRKLKQNRHGGVTWRGRDGRNIHLVLDGKFSYKGRAGPVFMADISEGKGRIIAIKDTGHVIGLDGARLWYALFGGGLKDIAESSKTDINKTLTLLMVGGGVAVAMVLGAVLYAINLLQQANTATGGAGGSVGLA